MISQVTLHNFQAHKKLQLQFSSKINCITGNTDIGKSAILRAIYWACCNKPKGNAFIRHGAKKVEVIVETGQHTIQRSRSKTKNEYILDGESFHSFGGNVPPQITQALKITKRQIQQQHDSPFWFGENAGEVNRQLNAIVDLKIIDTTLHILKTKTNKKQAEKTVLIDSIKGLKAQQKQLNFTNDLVEKSTRITQLQTSLCIIKTQRDQIKLLVELIEQINNQCAVWDDIIETSKELVCLFPVYQQTDHQLKQIQTSVQLVYDTDTFPDTTQALTTLLESKAALDTSEISIDQTIQKIKRLQQINSTLCHVQQQLDSKQQQIDSLNIPTCPTCKQKMF